MLFKKKKTVPTIVKKRSGLVDFAVLLIGCTLSALSFNLFLFPNNIAVGFSGLSVIANSLFGIRPSLFLLISYIIVLIFSFAVLGIETTKKAVIASILYPLLVEATSYLTVYIDVNNIEKVVLVFCGGLLSGFGSGLAYKVGYSTGGSDIISLLLNKLFKRPMGTCNIITNTIIISLGFLVFGLPTVIYSVIVVYLMSIVIDKVMIGISQSKTFEGTTKNETEVKRFLLSKLSHGVTILDGRGGYTGNVIKVIMCVVPTREYFAVKQGILNIDPKALIMVSDVYEVIGNK